MSLIMIMIIFCSLIFTVINHPMTMGLMLLIQTILISLMTSLLNLNFWFSYILFLIMIGGMLVLFIYMTSIASNEMFSFSSLILTTTPIPFLIFCMSLFMDNYLILLNSYFNENLLLKNYIYFMNKFFNYPSIMIYFLMVIYLFITLIAIVKITNMNFGPLRPNIN